MKDSIRTIKFQLTGRVQGVGIRFSIQRKARKIGLTGYVQNEMDGSVSGVIQGGPKDCETFFTWLNEKAPGRIDRVLKNTFVTQENFDSFHIYR